LELRQAYGRACDDFDRAIAALPERAGLYYHRGIARKHLGRVEEVGTTALMDILAWRSLSPRARPLPTLLLLDTQPQALEDFSRALTLGFEDVCAILLERGIMLKHNG
jgi:hypothetical protein